MKITSTSLEKLIIKLESQTRMVRNFKYVKSTRSKVQDTYIVAVVGDEVMVTEQYNESQIMVTDRELKYIRQIKGRKNVGIRHLHPDCHGNLYVSDSNANITVISKTGIFLHSFGREQNGIQQLKSQWVIHVSGQYVYVADWNLKKTVVFTTEGNYVTAFGCYGGIFVNQDGVVKRRFSFAFQGALHYNLLPQRIRSAPSVTSFKLALTLTNNNLL